MKKNFSLPELKINVVKEDKLIQRSLHMKLKEGRISARTVDLSSWK